MTATDLHIRWMIRRDMAEVLNIESESFEHPWSEEDFIRCLRQRTCIGMVVERIDSGQIVGYMIYELHKTRLHLLNLAVDRQFQRQGVGLAMIDKLVGKLHPDRRTSIMAEVRESNLEAQLFFREMGFRASRILRDFYDGATDDAYEFRYRLNQAGSRMNLGHRLSSLSRDK